MSEESPLTQQDESQAGDSSSDAASSEEETEKRRSAVLSAVRNVYLGALGAVALVEDEVERLARRMVEEGRATEQEGRRIISDFREKLKRNKSDLKGELDKAKRQVTDRWDVVDRVCAMEDAMDKLKILVDLHPCIEGFQGIPQDTRPWCRTGDGG